MISIDIAAVVFVTDLSRTHPEILEREYVFGTYYGEDYYSPNMKHAQRVQFSRFCKSLDVAEWYPQNGSGVQIFWFKTKEAEEQKLPLIIMFEMADGKDQF